MDIVYVVFEASGIGPYYSVVKIFRDREKAEKFCQEKNDINKPEFDSYGHCAGIYHLFHEMVVE